MSNTANMQGFNMGRYVPPDQEGVLSFNQASGKNHALGSRARNIGQGILTVRFEIPFPIWCTTCPKPTIIGQGVRFNAEKKKVGNYLSTPIYSFRMKHIACGGTIEIRTDPKNTAYVVTEGAKKRDTGEGKLREGEIIINLKTEEEKQRLENDPFAKLEDKVGDKKQAATEKARIEELYRANEQNWDDPGEANRKLRRAFRVERKIRHRKAEATEALQDRLGLGIELLEETDSDKRRAAHIDFGDAGTDSALTKAQSKPLFSPSNPPAKPLKPKKGAKALDQQKESLSKELSNNTRAVLDPFLNDNTERSKITPTPLIKRIRDTQAINATPPSPQPPVKDQGATIPLVDYDSD